MLKFCRIWTGIQINFFFFFITKYYNCSYKFITYYDLQLFLLILWIIINLVMIFTLESSFFFCFYEIWICKNSINVMKFGFISHSCSEFSLLCCVKLLLYDDFSHLIVCIILPLVEFFMHIWVILKFNCFWNISRSS